MTRPSATFAGLREIKLVIKRGLCSGISGNPNKYTCICKQC